MISARFVLLLAALAAFTTNSLFADDKAAPAKLPSYSDADAKQHIGDEATVTGLVAGVSTSKSGNTYLNLGARHPKEVFSGVILAEDAAKIPDPKQYDGKTVALSGKIEIRNNQPQMILKAPEQIKIVEPAAPAK